MYFYLSGMALYLGSLDILLQISRRDLKKDLRRELKKVLLQYVWLLLGKSLVLRTGWLACFSTSDWLVGVLI